MSYSDITPGYYQMYQPDSPWHAGASGWRDAPVPGWGENPNLVGPKRVGVEGLGGCGCSGVGDAATTAAPAATGMSSNMKGALLIGGAAVVLMALVGIPGIWDDA